MAQRESGYERQPRDHYATPAWVTRVLLADLEAQKWAPKANASRTKNVWEPAAGNRAMADVLREAGFAVTATDIMPGYQVKENDFLADAYVPFDCSWIITNPPYACETGGAMGFIRRGLEIIRERNGLLALLLPVDFDSAKTRALFFGECLEFKRKLVLYDRIEWFDRAAENAKIKAENVERRKRGEKPLKLIAGPSQNHAWFIWNADLAHMRPRTYGYGGKPAKTKAQKQFSDTKTNALERA